MTALRPRPRFLFATVAVLALMFSAGSAQAAPTFAAGSYPANLSSAAVESLIFHLEEAEVTCAVSTAVGSMTEAETMLTLTPTYEECQGVAHMNHLQGKVRVNGCFYTLTVTKKVANGEFSHVGKYALICPENSQVELELFNGLVTVCVWTIGPVAELEKMEYGTMATTPKTLTTNWLVEKIPYQRKVGTKTICGSANGSAEYDGNSKVIAFNEKGAQTDVEVTGS